MFTRKNQISDFRTLSKIDQEGQNRAISAQI